MTYKETVEWMFQQLPMYQSLGKTAYKKDLNNTILLSNYLNNPEGKFKSIHVAGTNGKGSTSHMIASVLQEAGYKVGLYTSPHLKDYRERIKINGKEISKQFVIAFIKKHKVFFEQNRLSFFEMTVGLAFDYFAKKEVDIAVVEVGLGGRLDSTNIIVPEVSVITNIGLDHTQFLGNTIAKIAAEKAGIIKTDMPVVIGEIQSETTSVFRSKSKSKNSQLYFAEEEVKEKYTSDLKGSYQSKNIKTAVSALRILSQKDFHISDTDIIEGLSNVVKNTGLKGRWQILKHKPKVICDTAHNKEGLTYVINQLQYEDYINLHIIFGVVNDKNLETILELIPKTALYYLCKPNVPRGLDTDILGEKFKEAKLNFDCFKSVTEAYNMAKEKANEDDLIFVGGSTFVVAEII